MEYGEILSHREENSTLQQFEEVLLKVPKPRTRIFPRTNTQKMFNRFLQENLREIVFDKAVNREAMRHFHDTLVSHASPPFSRVNVNDKIDFKHFQIMKVTLKNHEGLSDDLIDDIFTAESFLRFSRDLYGRILISEYFHKYVMRRFFIFDNLLDLLGMRSQGDSSLLLTEENAEDDDPNYTINQIIEETEGRNIEKGLLLKDAEYLDMDDFRSYLINNILRFNFARDFDKMMVSTYAVLVERKFLFHMPRRGLIVKFLDSKRYPVVLVSLKEILQSRVLADFREVCEKCLKDENVSNGSDISDDEEAGEKFYSVRDNSLFLKNWFTEHFFFSILSIFGDMDQPTRWSLSKEQFASFGGGYLTGFAIDRIFDCYCTQVPVKPGEFTFTNKLPGFLVSIHDMPDSVEKVENRTVEKRMRIEQFIDFFLAYKHEYEPRSVDYFWKIIDIDGKGYVDRETLKVVFKDMEKLVVEKTDWADISDKVNFDDLIGELFDMLFSPEEQFRRKNNMKVYRKDLRKIGARWILVLLDVGIFNETNPYRGDEEEESPGEGEVEGEVDDFEEQEKELLEMDLFKKD